MTWSDLLNPYLGGNRRLALRGFRISLAKLDALAEAAINDDEVLDHYWSEIVEETARLKSQLVTSEEKEWAANKQRAARDPNLAPAVRERDGDVCRYCGVTVTWTDRKSSAAATYSHITPGIPATTPDDLVVSCKNCDKLRERNYRMGKHLERPLPLNN